MLESEEKRECIGRGGEMQMQSIASYDCWELSLGSLIWAMSVPRKL